MMFSVKGARGLLRGGSITVQVCSCSCYVAIVDGSHVCLLACLAGVYVRTQSVGVHVCASYVKFDTRMVVSTKNVFMICFLQ